MRTKPYVVGIAGGTCSGKTTLTAYLAKNLGDCRLCVIHMDAYFKKNPPTTLAPVTGLAYVEHNHPDSFRLDELYAAFAAACESPDYDVVLFEGLLTLALTELRDRCDLKVFVDLKSDERLYRRIVRWGVENIAETAARYLDSVRYRHDEFVEPSRWQADLVLNGILDACKGKDILLGHIRAQLAD